MKISRKVVLLFVAMVILLNVVAAVWFGRIYVQSVDHLKQLQAKTGWTKPVFQYEVKGADNIIKKWEVKNVHSYLEPFHSNLIVRDNRIFISGSLSDSEHQSIIILNTFDGSLVWKSEPVEIGSEFSVDDNHLYLGVNSSGEIYRINLQDYQQDWNISIQPSHGPCCMQIVGDQLQAGWESNRFYILSKEAGSIIQVLENGGSPIFRVEQNIKYSRGGSSALMAGTLEGTELWSVILDEEYWQTPVFDETMIFVRSGISMGKVYAINRMTGEVLWTSPRNVVSTIGQSEEQVFFLTATGNLLGANKNDGKVEGYVQLMHNGKIPSTLSNATNYEVAYDSSHHSIYLLVADSAQLFAFEEK